VGGAVEEGEVGGWRGGGLIANWAFGGLPWAQMKRVAVGPTPTPRHATHASSRQHH
jgi:hypothetical protein